MIEKYSKTLRLLLGAALIFQTIGCGTILYPERRGQKGGRIDAGVAVLDAIGLLFFIIPGVIAFAVDFGNGTIYLPKTGKGLLNRNDLEKVKFDPKADAKASIEDILREKAGYNLDWQDKRLQVLTLENKDELPFYFARAVAAWGVVENVVTRNDKRPVDLSSN